ncbi:MAG: hypothetical protein A2131_00750 [Candidatus Sungbacteria bacterium GWC2_49_10]|uniref:tRNA N6-adenosine threonylcarbamoyltransferase n=1 Tax=Candidatus Sungbacteria bacterium GWC2_49_10 TaxID=1802263 RepID=A0A1G2K3C0_9BACT|nr:MAG: hypothetical protein A2131_00750 [Candidatus Sungbacteria bacterium GWC2_49_10]
MRILAIETSCDETAIAIAEFTGPKAVPRISVLSNIVSSQIAVHRKFGGVVPNLARREHEKNLTFILERAFKEARFSNFKFQITNHKQIPNSKIKKIEKILEREPELFERFKKHILPLKKPGIDAIAVTYGPGLAPALWVGVNFARALAVLWDKPLIPVNHMAGHFYSPLLQVEPRISNFQFSISKQIKNSKLQIQNVSFPTLGLLVSGGHTELVYAKKHGKWKIIGETRDDAAGEAFDKVARILGLPYPGGPAISAIAEMKLKVKNEKLKITLPRPMIATNDFDFSFSGLKTAVLYLARDLGKKRTKKLRPSIAKEFQNAVVDVLVKKTIRAAKALKVKTVLLGGGVAANHELRKRLETNLKKELPNIKYLIPDTRMAGDNALMIAIAAHFTGKKKAWNKVHADANLRLSR